MDRRLFSGLAAPPVFAEAPALLSGDTPPPLYRIPPAYADTFPFKRVGKASAPALPSKNGTPPPPVPLQLEAGLEAFTQALDRRQARHLLRRTGVGAAPLKVAALLGQTAEDAVSEMIAAALAAPMPEPPDWIDDGVPRDQREREIYFNETNPERLMAYYVTLMKEVYEGGLRERMLVFWHNHFVTELNKYLIAPYAYRYVTALRTHALGNFKDFVHAIGLDPAMLLYLNGTQNEVSAPNENYARELLELFTMGQFDAQGNENYTQQDIEEIARALTGWIADPFNLTVQLVTILHDFGEKTILGRTGAWGYDDVIDLLFEERAPQIAAFVCGKLYTEFVYAAPDEGFVAELAQVFLDHNFEIAPVVEALLTSAHFFDTQVLGAQIKSPIAMGTGLLHEAHTTPIDNQFLLLYFASFVLDQQILNPPNVAGWPGHHTWVNTTSFPTRLLVAEVLLFGDENEFPALDLIPTAEHLLAAVDETLDPGDPSSVFALATVLAEHLMPIAPDLLDLSAPSEGFAGDLINNPIPDEYLNGPAHALDLTKVLLLGIVPWYEWSLYRAEANIVLLLFARYLAQLPEYQLT